MTGASRKAVLPHNHACSYGKKAREVPGWGLMLAGDPGRLGDLPVGSGEERSLLRRCSPSPVAEQEPSGQAAEVGPLSPAPWSFSGCPGPPVGAPGLAHHNLK